jgi:hypothetical protein
MNELYRGGFLLISFCTCVCYFIAAAAYKMAVFFLLGK